MTRIKKRATNRYSIYLFITTLPETGKRARRVCGMKRTLRAPVVRHTSSASFPMAGSKKAGEELGEYLFSQDAYERVFEEAGDYPCVRRPHEDRGMTGRIIVAE